MHIILMNACRDSSSTRSQEPVKRENSTLQESSQGGEKIKAHNEASIYRYFFNLAFFACAFVM